MHRFIAALAIATLTAASGCGSPEESTDDRKSPTPPSDREPGVGAPEEIGGFSATSFPFHTTIEDDGTGTGGGYQEAPASLSFADGRQTPTMRWTCNFTVGMPLRTAVFGKIDAIHAAILTAEVATLSAGPLMHSRDVWLPALFCSEFKEKMRATFKSRFRGLGGYISP